MALLAFATDQNPFLRIRSQSLSFFRLESHHGPYEVHLVAEWGLQFPDRRMLSVGHEADSELPLFCKELLAVLLCIALYQALLVMFSSQLGLNEDDPFIRRETLNRMISSETILKAAP